MTKLTKNHRFIFAFIGTLTLIFSLFSSNAAFAATSRSDISIILVPNHSKVKMGQNITYTAYMTNHGPDNAIFVDVGFSLPGQLNFVSMTCDKGISPDSPNCEYLSLAAGETVVSRLVATPAPGALSHHKRLLTVAANVLFEINCKFDSNCTFDPNSRNNSARVTTVLIGK